MPRVVLHLAPRLSEIARINERLEAQATEVPLSTQILADMRLCLEEAVTNVVNHAFADIPDPTLRVELEAAPDVLIALVVDNGPAFDPLGHPLAPPLTDLGAAPIGGLGIRLLRARASALRYERLEVWNRLTITCRRRP